MNSLEFSSSDTPVISNEDVFNLHNLPSLNNSSSKGTYDQINELLGIQSAQEKAIKEAREILGYSARNLTDSQVYELTSEIQFFS